MGISLTGQLKKNPLLLLYKGISFQILKKNALVKEFFLSLKENPLETKDLKDFSLATKEFSINCLKENSLYKVTKDFALSQL